MSATESRSRKQAGSSASITDLRPAWWSKPKQVWIYSWVLRLASDFINICHFNQLPLVTSDNHLRSIQAVLISIISVIISIISWLTAYWFIIKKPGGTEFYIFGRTHRGWNTTKMDLTKLWLFKKYIWSTGSNQVSSISFITLITNKIAFISFICTYISAWQCYQSIFSLLTLTVQFAKYDIP